MTYTSRLIELIKRGREGDNQGLSLGMPKLEHIIDGLTQETYYLIAAGTGNGKTSFVLHSFIYKALLDSDSDKDVQFIIFSLEMSAEQLLAKLLSLHIYETYGKQISFKELLSRGKDSTLSDEDYELVQECIPWLESIEDRLIIHDGTLNSEKYKSLIIEDLRKFGTFVDEDTYELNNPKQIIAVITDHLGLVRPQSGRSKKEEIDTISAYGVSFRNKCKISPINIMQFNRNANNAERLKQGLQEPDLSDSGNQYSVRCGKQYVPAWKTGDTVYRINIRYNCNRSPGNDKYSGESEWNGGNRSWRRVDDNCRSVYGSGQKRRGGLLHKKIKCDRRSGNHCKLPAGICIDQACDSSWRHGACKCKDVFPYGNLDYACEADCMDAGICSGIRTSCGGRRKIFYDHVVSGHVAVPILSVRDTDPISGIWTDGRLDRYVCRLDSACSNIYMEIP